MRFLLLFAAFLSAGATAAPAFVRGVIPTTATVPIVPPMVGGTHKWTPGHYVQDHAAHGTYCGTGCDARRESKYGIYLGCGSSCNAVKGAVLWVVWKFLEDDAGNNFVSGFSWLHGQISYINTNYPGKKVGVMVYIDPYGQGTDTASQNANFPTYVVSAGCTHGTAQNDIQFDITNSTCRGYLKRMLNAYGAEFDSDATLTFVRIGQETDSDINNSSKISSWEEIMLTATTAFPTTPIDLPLNWLGSQDSAANKEALVSYLKSIQGGFGEPDTEPSTVAPFQYPCPSTNLPCVIRGLNSSIGASSHDYCGEVVTMPAVELSEMGYHSVGGNPGLTSQQVVNSANSDHCAQFVSWDLNDNEVQDRGDGGDTQFFTGGHGQLWAMNGCGGACVLSHSSKPAGFN